MGTKAQWWMLTIPHNLFVPFLPDGIRYIRGQLEEGGKSGFLHWQLVVCLSKQNRMSFIKKLLGEAVHCEPTRSAAALQYVWKEETQVQGTQFELGGCPFKRNSAVDWDHIRTLATSGDITNPGIPGDVYVRYYSSLRNIAKDHARPVMRGPQEVNVFWGKSGTGKTRRVFEEAGETWYIKTPTNKWWDAYQGEETVILDEFRGIFDICHMLRWLDRYPCAVEIKGSQVPLKTKRWFITSNLSPEEWYPNLDEETKRALLRRLTNIVQF